MIDLDKNVDIVSTPPTHKTCKCCGKLLPLEKFMKYGKGYKHTCKDCITSKFKKTRNNSNNNTSTDKFKDFTSRELIAELRHRGYKGNLTFTITKEIVL